MPQIYQGNKARNQATHVLAIRNNPVEQNQWTSKPYNRIAAMGLVKKHLNEGSTWKIARETLSRRYHRFISAEPLQAENFTSHITESDFISKITQLKPGSYMGLRVHLVKHTITLHIIQDKEVTHFIYINLGGVVPAGIRAYSINHNEARLFAHTVYQAFSPSRFKTTSARSIREFILNNKDKINSKLSQALTMKKQKVGNCVMASGNAIMRLQYTANIMRSYDMDLQQAHNFVRPLYKEVMRQDRRAAFDFLLTHPEYFANEAAHAYDILQCLLKFDNKDKDKGHPTDYIQQIAQQGCWIHVLQQRPREFSAYLNSYVYVQNDRTPQLYYIGDKLKKIKLIDATKFAQELQKLVINLGVTSFNLNGQEAANLINPHVATKDKYHPPSELILNLLAKASNKHTFATYYAKKQCLLLGFMYPKIMSKYFEDNITQQLDTIEKKIIHYMQSNEGDPTKIDKSFKILNILSYLLQQLKEQTYPEKQIYSNIIVLLLSSAWKWYMKDPQFIKEMTEKFGQELLNLLKNTKNMQIAMDELVENSSTEIPLQEYSKYFFNIELNAITNIIEHQKTNQNEEDYQDLLTYLLQQREKYSAEDIYFCIAKQLFNNINSLDELRPNFWQAGEKILEILDNEHHKNLFIEKYLELNYADFERTEPKNDSKNDFRQELQHRMEYIISYIKTREKFIAISDTKEQKTEEIKEDEVKSTCIKPLKPEIQVTSLPASPLNLSSLDEVCKYIQTYYPISKLNGEPITLFKLMLTNVAAHLSGKIPSELMQLLHKLQQMEDLNYEHYVSCITAPNKYHKERKLVAEAIENEFGVLQILGKDDARKQSINQIKTAFIKFQTDNDSYAPVKNSFFQNFNYSNGHFTSLLAYGKFLHSNPNPLPPLSHHHIF